MTYETQTQQTDLLIDNLIANNLPKTLEQIRETLVNHTFVLYPTEENKAMIEKIDNYFSN